MKIEITNKNAHSTARELILAAADVLNEVLVGDNDGLEEGWREVCDELLIIVGTEFVFVFPLVDDFVFPSLSDFVFPSLDDFVFPSLDDFVIPSLDDFVFPWVEPSSGAGDGTREGLIEVGTPVGIAVVDSTVGTALGTTVRGRGFGFMHSQQGQPPFLVHMVPSATCSLSRQSFPPPIVLLHQLGPAFSHPETFRTLQMSVHALPQLLAHAPRVPSVGKQKYSGDVGVRDGKLEGTTDGFPYGLVVGVDVTVEGLTEGAVGIAEGLSDAFPVG